MELIKLLVDVAQIATGIGVAIAIPQLFIARRQLYFASITRCVAEFQSLDMTRGEQSESKIRKYVDLVGEELFYFQNGYVPKTIALEWIDGMLDFIPILDERSQVVNESNCLLELARKRDYYLRGYPRIRHSFVIRGQYVWANAFGEEVNIDLRSATRMAIVEEVYQNLKNYSF